MSEFKYYLNGTGAVICGYTGNATELVIPEEIDGHRVVAVDGGLSGLSKDFDAKGTIEKVILPNTLGEIKRNAFSYCPNLREVVIPDSVYFIEEETFWSSGLTSVTIPNSVKHMGKYAFRDCKKLESINISNGVRFTGGWVFDGCTSLKEITLGNDARTDDFGKCIFWGSCKNGPHLNYRGKIYPIHNSQDFYDVVYEHQKDSVTTRVAGVYNYTVENGKAMIVKYTGRGGDVVIPDTLDEYEVAYIGAHAFEDLNELNAITMPDTIRTIGASAFEDCPNLTTVTFSKNLVSIDEAAFYNDKKLKDVTLPEGIIYLGYCAFDNCDSMKEITLPSTLAYWETNGLDIKNGTVVHYNGLSIVDDDLYHIDDLINRANRKPRSSNTASTYTLADLESDIPTLFKVICNTYNYETWFHDNFGSKGAESKEQVLDAIREKHIQRHGLPENSYNLSDLEHDADTLMQVMEKHSDYAAWFNEKFPYGAKSAVEVTSVLLLEILKDEDK